MVTIPQTRPAELTRERGLTAEDLVIETLAESEAELREHVDRLLDIIARLAYDNFVLRRTLEIETVERIQGDGQLARERARRYAQQRAAAA
jgi:hypothetical protein